MFLFIKKKEKKIVFFTTVRGDSFNNPTTPAATGAWDTATPYNQPTPGPTAYPTLASIAPETPHPLGFDDAHVRSCKFFFIKKIIKKL